MGRDYNKSDSFVIVQPFLKLLLSRLPYKSSRPHTSDLLGGVSLPQGVLAGLQEDNDYLLKKCRRLTSYLAAAEKAGIQLRELLRWDGGRPKSNSTMESYNSKPQGLCLKNALKPSRPIVRGIQVDVLCCIGTYCFKVPRRAM